MQVKQLYILHRILTIDIIDTNYKTNKIIINLGVVKLFKKNIEPRFGDTDFLGHINNVAVAGWFELARNDLYRLIVPGMGPEHCPLTMAASNYEFVAETYFGKEVEVQTYIDRIGNSSFTIAHKLFQNNTLCVRGTTTLVYFDHDTKSSKPIPDTIREILQQHLVENAK